VVSQGGFLTQTRFEALANSRGYNVAMAPRNHAAGYGIAGAEHNHVTLLTQDEVCALTGYEPTRDDPIVTRCKCGAYMVG